MSATDVLGYVAGALTAASQLPQAIKAWRSRSAGDISLKTLLLLSAGLATWIAYGIATRAWPVIAANAISLVITGAVLAAKLRFG